MGSLRGMLALAAAALLPAGLSLAQSVISARSGLVHYVEGRVLINDEPVEVKFGTFPDVKENATLRTEEGRAEILLTPGVFLRVGENSSFRMITNRLIDTRVEFLSGSMVVEAAEPSKDNSVSVVYQSDVVTLRKKGIYRFDSSPAQLRVFDGAAEAQVAGKTIEVKEGKALTLDGSAETAKFDKNASDALNRWSRRRGEYIAMANVYAAKSIKDSGMSWSSGGWAWNPYFGMFTFIPTSGMYYSPYGFRFWSPLTVYRVYQPRPVYIGSPIAGGGIHPGYRTPVGSISGRSAPMATAAPSAHAPTATGSGGGPAPIPRGAGGGHGARR